MPDFISDNRAGFGARRLCRVLGVSRSGYYRHLATEEAYAERQPKSSGPWPRSGSPTPSTTAPTELRACMPNSAPGGRKINR
jgi:hypothetical protein